MRPSEALAIQGDAIRKIPESNSVRNVRVFGSVLHGTDTEPRPVSTLDAYRAIHREAAAVRPGAHLGGVIFVDQATVELAQVRVDDDCSTVCCL